MAVPHLRILPAGDSALLVEVGTGIDVATNQVVHAMAEAIWSRLPTVAGVDIVAAYASLLVRYDPSVLPVDQVIAAIQAAFPARGEFRPAHRFSLPILYGGEAGPDLAALAQYHGIDIGEVIERHARRDYRVYCIGFSPGFPYLGDLDPALHTPRLDTPRTRVPAGSLAIGGSQTGVYPTSTPGGWRVIGRTPLVLFDPESDPPVTYRPGDQIRFVPVGQEEFSRLARARITPAAEAIE